MTCNRSLYYPLLPCLLNKDYLFAEVTTRQAEYFVSEDPKKWSESRISFHHALQDDEM